MAKNKTSKFNVDAELNYTQDTQKTQKTQEIIETSKNILEIVPEEVEKKIGRPRKKESEKLRGYRYNLNLDRDLKGYIDYISWKNRTSITQYLNDLIRADMEIYIEKGGSESEWTKTK